MLLSLLALCACRERHAPDQTLTSGTPNTQTIAPAAGDVAPTGTDAMTQTVDIEDSRSEDDGGAINNKQTAKTPGSTTTTATTATTTTTATTPKKKP